LICVSPKPKGQSRYAYYRHPKEKQESKLNVLLLAVGQINHTNIQKQKQIAKYEGRYPFGRKQEITDWIGIGAVKIECGFGAVTVNQKPFFSQPEIKDVVPLYDAYGQIDKGHDKKQGVAEVFIL
jgi:hypothetical protein